MIRRAAAEIDDGAVAPARGDARRRRVPLPLAHGRALAAHVPVDGRGALRRAPGVTSSGTSTRQPRPLVRHRGRRRAGRAPIALYGFSADARRPSGGAWSWTPSSGARLSPRARWPLLIAHARALGVRTSALRGAGGQRRSSTACIHDGRLRRPAATDEAGGRRFVQLVAATVEPDGRRSLTSSSPPSASTRCWGEIRECLEKGWTGLGYKTVEIEQAWRAHTRPAARPLPGLGERRAAPGAAAAQGASAAGRTATRSSPRRSPSSPPTTPSSTSGCGRCSPTWTSTCASTPRRSRERITPAHARGDVRRPGRQPRPATPRCAGLCRERGLTLILDAAHMAGTWMADGTHAGADADVDGVLLPGGQEPAHRRLRA